MTKRLSFFKGDADIYFEKAYDFKEEIKNFGNFSWDPCEKVWTRSWYNVDAKKAAEILKIFNHFDCEATGRRLEMKIAQLEELAK